MQNDPGATLLPNIRKSPLGTDSQGNCYWLLDLGADDGVRLYKEGAPKCRQLTLEDLSR